MSFKRAQYEAVLSRLKEPRDKMQVIVGPRQVGKTTLIGQVLEEIFTPYDSYSADDRPGVTNDWLEEIWETQRQKMDFRKETKRILVIDEVQKIPNWSETVKALWDKDTKERRQLSVVLLGSSRMLIQRGLTESLMGRFELIRLPHWTYTEMRDCFGVNLQQYIYFGGYPGAVSYINDETRWRNYIKDSLIEPSISKDVLYDTRITKPQLLRQLFEIGASSSGEMISLNKVGARLQDAGNITTLAGYEHLLDECELLAGLQKYAHNTARKYNSVPKWQVYNNALRNAYATLQFQEAVETSNEWGRFVESAIGAYLVSQAAIHDYQLYYWREGKLEVDFVLVQRGKMVAIEVKSGQKQKNAGLPAFKERFKPYKAIVVGGDGFSIEEFLGLDLGCLFG